MNVVDALNSLAQQVQQLAAQVKQAVAGVQRSADAASVSQAFNAHAQSIADLQARVARLERQPSAPAGMGLAPIDPNYALRVRGSAMPADPSAPNADPGTIGDHGQTVDGEWSEEN